jgi:hypothetical protein
MEKSSINVPLPKQNGKTISGRAGIIRWSRADIQ